MIRPRFDTDLETIHAAMKKGTRSLRSFLCLALVLVSVAVIAGAAEEDGLCYREYVRQCVEVLIEHGTDRYGQVQSPLLMNILDVQTRTCPENPLPLDEAYRVIRRERARDRQAGICMPTRRRPLQAMYRLSQATGQPRYAEFADTSIGYYLKELVDEKGFSGGAGIGTTTPFATK